MYNIALLLFRGFKPLNLLEPGSVMLKHPTPENYPMFLVPSGAQWFVPKDIRKPPKDNMFLVKFFGSFNL